MKFKVGVLTVSDQGSVGRREDTSGPAIKELVGGIGGEVVQYRIVPDELDQIRDALIAWSDQDHLDLILTTGGTGFALRDVTPEATAAAILRPTPGLNEAIRAAGLAHTPKAMLSRAVSGIRGRTLIVNLPGSEKGVRESLAAILPVLPHGLELLAGRGGDCGGPT